MDGPVRCTRTYVVCLGSAYSAIVAIERHISRFRNFWQGRHRIYVHVARLASDRDAMASTEWNGAFHCDSLCGRTLNLQSQDALRHWPILDRCRSLSDPAGLD